MMNDREFCDRASYAVLDYLFRELNLHPGRNDYRIVSRTSGPRVFTMSMVLYPRHAPKIIALAEQLSMVTALDSDARIRIARGNRGTLSLQIPKPGGPRGGLWYDVKVSHLPRHRGVRASLGVDTDHRPATVDFGNPLTPHLLTAGTTGSGKTNMIRLLVYDLVSQNQPEDLKLILIDTCKRGSAWLPFRHLPHLAHPIVTSEADALQVLAWTVAEIGRRSEERRTKPELFVCIDEAQSVLDRPEFVKVIGDITATGREFRIHVVLSTQDPTAQQLGDRHLKSNLTLRIVGKVDSGQSAAIATGIPDTGAQFLQGAGDMLLVQPAGTTRICTALLEEKDTNDLPAIEEVGRLDLSEYEDIDHVLSQSGIGGPSRPGGKESPIDARQLAIALATGGRINYLQRELHIGASRATRLREFADLVAAELGILGYTIIPGSMPSPTVTESAPDEPV